MMTEQIQKKKKHTKAQRKKAETVLIAALKKGFGINAVIKQPSPRFQKALDDLIPDFGKLQTKVDKCFELGRKEGYDDRNIGSFIREKMKPHYHPNTITNVFEKYPNAKHQEKARSVTNNVTNDQKVTKNVNSDGVTDGETDQETNDTKTQYNEEKIEEIIEKGREQIKDAIEQHDNEVADITDQFRNWKEIIAAKNKLIEELREELAGKDKGLTTKDKKIAQLERQLSQKDKEIADLERRIAELEKAIK